MLSGLLLRAGSFILWFNIGFEIPPTLTSTLLQLVVMGTDSMGCAVGGGPGACGGAFNYAGPPLSGIGAVPVLSREILLWRAACMSSLTGSLPLGHEGRGQASPVVHSWQPRSNRAKHAALASCGVAGKPC